MFPKSLNLNYWAVWKKSQYKWKQRCLNTLQVVGDHVVTVNETVYHKNDGGVRSVFRIKVIDVSPNKDAAAEKKPSSEKPTSVEEVIEVELPGEKDVPTETETTPEEQASTETVEEFDNEIPSQVGPEVMWNVNAAFQTRLILSECLLLRS